MNFIFRVLVKVARKGAMSRNSLQEKRDTALVSAVFYGWISDPSFKNRNIQFAFLVFTFNAINFLFCCGSAGSVTVLLLLLKFF